MDYYLVMATLCLLALVVIAFWENYSNRLR
jgi:hypothetical protein